MVLLLSSCAKEEVINIDESNEPSIVATSKLADLIQRTSLNDGSKDNIIDRANCFNVQLPTTVTVNGITLNIGSEDDFDTIEAIFEEFENDDDELEISFPITIILSDYTQVLINNENELNSYIDSCNGENEIDDDIECLDFQYPIGASVFNTISEIVSDITIDSDEEMYDFIENLSENDVATLVLPITITLSDGSQLSIASLDQLENQIEILKDDCDEDDDFDFNDDDIDGTNTTEQEFVDYLVSCPFSIDEVEINEQNIENLRGAILTFASDGTLTAELNNITTNGTWSTATDNGLRLDLSMDTLTEINNNWRLNKIVEEDDGKDQVDLRLGIDELKLIKNCN
jgi:hypothetical protein